MIERMTAIILIYGNPIDGFQYVGPFADPDSATGYAERHFSDIEWWIAPLERVSSPVVSLVKK